MPPGSHVQERARRWVRQALRRDHRPAERGALAASWSAVGPVPCLRPTIAGIIAASRPRCRFFGCGFRGHLPQGDVDSLRAAAAPDIRQRAVPHGCPGWIARTARPSGGRPPAANPIPSCLAKPSRSRTGGRQPAVEWPTRPALQSAAASPAGQPSHPAGVYREASRTVSITAIARHDQAGIPDAVDRHAHFQECSHDNETNPSDSHRRRDPSGSRATSPGAGGSHRPVPYRRGRQRLRPPGWRQRASLRPDRGACTHAAGHSNCEHRAGLSRFARWAVAGRQPGDRIAMRRANIPLDRSDAR